MSIHIWYPIDIHKHMWVCNVYESVSLSLATVFFVYSKVVPITMLLLVVTHVKILHVQLKDLDGKVSALAAKENLHIQRAKTILIKEQIRKHQEIIR